MVKKIAFVWAFASTLSTNVFSADSAKTTLKNDSDKIAIIDFTKAFDQSPFRKEIAKLAEDNQKELIERINGYQAKCARAEAQLNEAASRSFSEGGADFMSNFAEKQQELKAQQNLDKTIMENTKARLELEVQSSVARAKTTLQEWARDFAVSNKIGAIFDSGAALVVLNDKLEKTADFIEFVNTKYNQKKAIEGLSVTNKDSSKTVLNFAKNDNATDAAATSISKA